MEPPEGQRIVRMLPHPWQLAARLEAHDDAVVQSLRIPTDGLARLSVPLEVIERRGFLEMTLLHRESGVTASA